MKSNKDNKFGSIEAARKIGISTERLSYWERTGIVQPTYIQCGTRKFRRYSLQDIERAVIVRALVTMKSTLLKGQLAN
ncbi:MAG: MerR family transcriptional regulator [Planctomycetes bacterium]|nr:MerR family transcriptional regulator [Planctomycetota bacterium]